MSREAVGRHKREGANLYGRASSPESPSRVEGRGRRWQFVLRTQNKKEEKQLGREI